MNQNNSPVICLSPRKGPSLHNIEYVTITQLRATYSNPEKIGTPICIHRDVPEDWIYIAKNAGYTLDSRPVIFWEQDHFYNHSENSSQKPNELTHLLIPKSIVPQCRKTLRKRTQGNKQALEAKKAYLFNNDIRKRLLTDRHGFCNTTLPTIGLIIPTHRPQNIDLIYANISRQSVQPAEVIIAVHGDMSHFHKLSEKFLKSDHVKHIHITKDKSVGFVLNRLVESSQCDLIIKMDDDDLYGNDYIRDLFLTHVTTQCPIVGKAPEAIYFSKSDNTYIRRPGLRSRHRICTPSKLVSGSLRVSGSTLSGLRQHFLEYPFDEEVLNSVDSRYFEQYESQKFRIAIDDGYNYLTIRHTNIDTHRWKIRDEALKENALRFCDGPSDLWSGVELR